MKKESKNGGRHELTGKQFSQEHVLPGRSGHVGVTASNNRRFIDEAVFYWMRWFNLPLKQKKYL